MGTKIGDIVNVNITRETARLLAEGFGTTLILSEVSQFYDRVMTFSEPEELLTLGFSDTHPVYLAAISLYSQEQAPKEFKVGRKYANVNAKQKLLFDAIATGGSFKIGLDAEQTASIAYNANAAAIKSALEALDGIQEVTVTGDMPALSIVVEFTGADANKHFNTMTLDISSLTGVTSASVEVLQYGSAAESWSQALNNVLEFDDKWYGLVATTRTKADILALAAIMETKNKIYCACSEDADVLTSSMTDVASSLKALAYNHTFYLWSSDQEHYPEAAWFYLLTYQPGSVTWKFKTLVGIKPDSFTTTQLNYLKSKYCNFYETVAGINLITGDGIVASGEYIDIIWGIHWLHARIGERVFLVLAQADKVPFTEAGIALVINPLRAQLLEAANSPYNLIVESSIVIDEPAIENIDPSEKADRILSGIAFSATLQGAVHYVNINGKLYI